MGKWLSILIIVLSICVPVIPVSKVSATEAKAETLVISEVQTTGCATFLTDNPPICSSEDPKKEFVELRNLLSTDVLVDNWRLEYVSASGLTVTELAILNGVVSANGSVLISYDSYRPNDIAPDMFFAKTNTSGFLAKSGGHVRLVNGEEIVDLVGWGSAEATDTWPKISTLLPEYSTKRILPDDPLYSSEDKFTPASFPILPESGGFISNQSEHTDEQQADPQVPDTQPACDGTIVSEVLPNPDGVDTGREFVEIHNPTDSVISLNGCLLGLSGTSKTYAFADGIQLEPGEYRAFYDDLTGLTLPNAAGGEVLLINGNTEYPFSYPAEMKDGESWVLLGTTWQKTDNPTPGTENIPMTHEPVSSNASESKSQDFEPCPEGKYRNPETNRCKSIESSTNVLKPCSEGQVRNPATNRCKSIVAELTSYTPCKSGQVRNPQTNRCKSVSSTNSRLTPCKPNQKRNPATNRCRSVLAAHTALKVCDPGEERNPETNRCRKVEATLASAKVKSKDNVSKNMINYGILGLVSAGVLGYGAYEYRNDFRNKFADTKTRLFAKKSGK